MSRVWACYYRPLTGKQIKAILLHIQLWACVSLKGQLQSFIFQTAASEKGPELLYILQNVTYGECSSTIRFQLGCPESSSASKLTFQIFFYHKGVVRAWHMLPLTISRKSYIGNSAASSHMRWMTLKDQSHLHFKWI